MDKDRLSSLPDPLISHILSLMPTKYAVRTSILSNAWKQRFLAVPSIVINEPSLFCHANLTPDGRINYRKLDFIKFVNRMLMLSKTSSIAEFRLECQKFPELPVIDLWIFNLLLGNFVVLEIEQPHQPYSVSRPLLCPPPEMFSSTTLGVLKLCGPDIVLKFPQRVFFPKLKVLYLKGLAMQIESDSLTFGDGYPLLEDLRFEDTRVRTTKYFATLEISIITLQNLAIVSAGRCKIDIDTPHLQHLILKISHSDFFGDVKLRRSCKSIISADFYQDFEFRGGCIFYVRVLSMINSVKVLRISKGFSETFSQQTNHSLPEFPNLTNLELASFGETMWIMLQRAPILKALVYDMECMENCLVPESEPWCVGNSLREIRITSFKGGEAECAVVRYLMEHAVVLEKMLDEAAGFV